MLLEIVASLSLMAKGYQLSLLIPRNLEGFSTPCSRDTLNTTLLIAVRAFEMKALPSGDWVLWAPWARDLCAEVLLKSAQFSDFSKSGELATWLP